MKIWRVLLRKRGMILAAVTLGTTFQLSTCGDQASLFALRTAFSSFTLPLNTLMLQFFAAIAQAVPTVITPA